ncbi:uncharacterized protein CCOS01_11691 [Colletotrichum costaricense]|uniref:Uncharacterized protein n=1 Tax=Colletotrichum costaricense TaxID=1209916 RepID=A0AAI9YPM5_9PEZI|nr:uncharacterized protein CCOS01_11691 [Colletotrichum costaricense]KAK1518871.1 hypothetical protein CCOS01_11691 [Colletotrichum costaricense]
MNRMRFIVFPPNPPSCHVVFFVLQKSEVGSTARATKNSEVIFFYYYFIPTILSTHDCHVFSLSHSNTPTQPDKVWCAVWKESNETEKHTFKKPSVALPLLSPLSVVISYFSLVRGLTSQKEQSKEE